MCKNLHGVIDTEESSSAGSFTRAESSSQLSLKPQSQTPWCHYNCAWMWTVKSETL